MTTFKKLVISDLWLQHDVHSVPFHFLCHIESYINVLNRLEGVTENVKIWHMLCRLFSTYGLLNTWHTMCILIYIETFTHKEVWKCFCPNLLPKIWTNDQTCSVCLMYFYKDLKIAKMQKGAVYFESLSLTKYVKLILMLYLTYFVIEKHWKWTTSFLYFGDFQFLIKK